MNNQPQEVLLKTTAGPEKPGFNWLGYGYMGYGCYADTESKTPYPVYDMSNQEALVDDINKSTYEIYTGTSKKEYYDNRFAKLKVTGSYELFSGTVTTSFDASTLQNQNLTLGTAIRIQKNYRLSMPDSATLSKVFLDDLVKLKPADLFNKYGTHVLRSFVAGARYEASSFLEDDKTENKSKTEASLDGGLKEMINASADGGVENKNTVQTIKERAIINCYGGGMEKDYEAWFSHLQEKLQDKDYIGIAAFEENSLIPLYEVLDDSDPRKPLLKAGFDEYMAAHAAPITEPVKPAVPLKYGDHFMLYTDDGSFVVSAVTTAFPNPAPVYPMLRATEGVPLYLDGENPGNVDLAKHVFIRTTEKSLGESNYLGRFMDFKAYYSFKGQDEEKWVVKKVEPGADKNQLFDGDLLEISMLDWPDNILYKYGDYLSTTTTPTTTPGTKWKIVKCK